MEIKLYKKLVHYTDKTTKEDKTRWNIYLKVNDSLLAIKSAIPYEYDQGKTNFTLRALAEELEETK